MFNPKSFSGPGMKAYAAPSLFQPHRARQAIRDAHEGKIPPLMGFYFGLSSVPLARFIAPFGFDMAWIDWEHSSCNTETMTDMVHSISFMSEGRTMPFVRIPGHDHAAVGYVLDAGANIVVPQVETVEQCQHVISAAKFGTHSRGTRSAPPFRYVLGLTDTCIDPSRSIWKNLNDQAAIMIQIETLKGIENLDEILTKCPEIDAVWLGTLDCRVSMNMEFNVLGPDMGDEWNAAIKLYTEVVTKHNKPIAGFGLGPPEAIKYMGQGKSIVVVGSDVVGLLTQSDVLAMSRELLPPLNNPPIMTEESKMNGTSNGCSVESKETSGSKEIQVAIAEESKAAAQE